MLDVTTRDTLIASLPHAGLVVEVGVFCGDFSEVILSQNIPAELYLIDPWDKQEGTVWGEKDWTAKTDQEANYQRVCQKFAGNERVHIIRDYSLAASEGFGERHLDIIYIDGDHTKAAEDIAVWWPKLKGGGYMCFHDYGWDCEYVTVTRDVNQFAASQGLPVLSTQDKVPTAILRKP